MTKQETNWLKKRKVTTSFAIAAFLSGFIFLDGSSTGNAVLSDGIKFNPVSFIGLILIFCSAILAFYSIKSQ